MDPSRQELIVEILRHTMFREWSANNIVISDSSLNSMWNFLRDFGINRERQIMYGSPNSLSFMRMLRLERPDLYTPLSQWGTEKKVAYDAYRKNGYQW